MTRAEAERFFLRTYLIVGWPVEQRNERLSRRQIVARLRRVEAAFELHPPARVDPDPPGASRERAPFLRRWRRGA